MDSLTNSERIPHGSLYWLTFVTGLVDAGSSQHDRKWSIGGSFPALGFALLGGFLAGTLDSWVGNRRRNLWLDTTLAIETLILLLAIKFSWNFGPRGGQPEG